VSLLSRLSSLWRNLTRRARIERDLDDEMRATLDQLVVEHVRRGASPDAARRAAARELRVESIKEQVRDVRAGAFVDTLAQDIRYAARLLRRYPLFALTATLSLAIGIAANTAVFTIANSLLRFSPVAVAEPERLVDMGRSVDDIPVGFNPTSYPDYLDIRRRTKTLEHVYGHPLFPKEMTLTSDEGVERVVADIVTTNYFAALGTRSLIGRLFEPGESDQIGASPIVVLSHRFWTRRFNGDRGIVGQTVRLNRYPVTVVGVAPEGFQGTTIVAVDLWVPISMVTLVTGSTPEQLDARNSGWIVMGARLRSGVTVAQAASELGGIDRALRDEYPGPQPPRPFRVQPASPMAGNVPLAAAAVVLLGAIASAVLAIACANVASLLLARASGRRREMALRLAIGAGRPRLVRQLLTETVLLFVLGAGAGIVLAKVMIWLLLGMLPVLPIPVQISLAVDWRVMGFACGLSLVAALLSGLAPALHASRADVSSVLKDESGGASARFRTRNVFVVAQVSLSVVLIVIGALFTRALSEATSVDAGFDARNVEVASLDSSLLGDAPAPVLGVVRDVLDRVRQLPGVESVSVARTLPLAAETLGFGLSLPGAVPAPGQLSADVPATGNVVEPGYFATMRIPLVSGRDFTEQDSAGAPLVAIVGEAAARRFWPGQNPIGQQLVMSGATPGTNELRQVIGVARDHRSSSLDFGAVPFVYVPFRQRLMSSMTLVVRTSAGRRVAGDIRRLVASIDPAFAAVSPQTLAQVIAVSLTPQRIVAYVAGSLGIVGVLLAAIGIYGVAAYTAAQRTREIAIRAALGAQRRSIIGIVLRTAIALTTIGAVIGLALASLAGLILSMLLVGVSPIDPIAWLAAVILCAVVVLTACAIPVRRAMRIEPNEALRYE
jgi:predicted permease